MQEFLARRSIFDSERAVYGSELLYRSSLKNYFDGTNRDRASLSAADNMLLFGMERSMQGHRAFINCTRGPSYIITQPAAKGPRRDRDPRGHQTGRQSPGDLPATQAQWVLDYARRLSRLPRALIALADFIKVDVLATTRKNNIAWPAYSCRRMSVLCIRPVNTSFYVA